MLHVWIFAYYFAFIYRCMFQLEPFFKGMVCCFPSQVLKKLMEATTKQITHGKSLKFLTIGNGHPRWNESHKNPCDIESTRESGSVQLPKRIFERKKVGSFLWWVISNKNLRIQDSGICTRCFLVGFMSRRCLLLPLGFLIAPFSGWTFRVSPQRWSTVFTLTWEDEHIWNDQRIGCSKNPKVQFMECWKYFFLSTRLLRKKCVQHVWFNVAII